MRDRRVEQKGVLEGEDRAPVLHRRETARTRDRDQVELRQGIGHPEVVVVEREELGCALQREPPLVRAALAGDNGDGRGAGGLLQPLKIANGQKQQVGRHLGALLEADTLASVGQRSGLLHRHV